LWVDRFERWGTAAENFILVTLLISLIVLAVGEIALRMFFSVGFVWAGELINLIVLWITIVASVAACRSDRHLRIDAMSHFVAKKYARFPRMIVDAFAAGICGVLAWHSYRYVQLTLEFEDTVLTDIPAWYAFSVVPVAFVLMAYRFLLASGSQLLQVAGVIETPPEESS
jgi:TRAP-type C4-dicarboxylate transport system permease small subunit